MNFISASFLAFFLITGIVYFCIPKRMQWGWLLAASLFFYLCSDLRYFLFLLFGVLSTYGAAIWIKRWKEQKRKARLVLTGVLVLNLGLLVFLKFFDYSMGLFAALAQMLGAQWTWEPLGLILPLGISFYTLQIAGYCIDVYRGKIEPQKNLAKYALFVTFFPQILQGPIPRYDQLAPQLLGQHSFDYVRVKQGLQLMLWGFFQKMVLADRAAVLVNEVFQNHTEYAGGVAVLAAFAYTLQIYADFSGCVNIARGAAQVLGIELMQNFKLPYFSTSIAGFWRRWHISLSSWLRDYVYIPLGGNRKGALRKYLNVMLVFLVSGLWHGTGIHYLVWGLLHGAYQVMGALLSPLRERIAKGVRLDRIPWLRTGLQILITFLLVNIAWIFFRAPDTATAVQIIASMFQPQGVSESAAALLGILNWKNLVLLAGCCLLQLGVSLLQTRFALRQRFNRLPLLIRWGVYFAGIASVLVFGYYGPGYDSAAFIYMQF